MEGRDLRAVDFMHHMVSGGPVGAVARRAASALAGGVCMRVGLKGHTTRALPVQPPPAPSPAPSPVPSPAPSPAPSSASSSASSSAPSPAPSPALGPGMLHNGAGHARTRPGEGVGG